MRQSKTDPFFPLPHLEIIYLDWAPLDIHQRGLLGLALMILHPASPVFEP
jgi:hypothetical protein